MIEKMKNVCIVSSVSDKEKMLSSLRALGILHIAEKKSADRKVSEKFINLSKTASILADYVPDKKELKKMKAVPKPEILSDEDFQKLYEKVQNALDQKEIRNQNLIEAKNEIERIQAWGEIIPEELKEVREKGFDLHFYRVGKKELKALEKEKEIKFIKLSAVDKMPTVAVIGKIPDSIPATEFKTSDKSIFEWEEEIKSCESDINNCNQVLREASFYDESFKHQMLKAQNEENYSSAYETAGNDDDLVWITGYVPESDLSGFKAAAAQNNWAYAVDDVSKEDDKVPTKIKYNKVSKLIKPVFDILGILPGYRETDISLWFFLFFVLFFAMIIGDAGYGVIILLVTIGLTVKSRKLNTTIYLLYILSIATIAWGAVTGTWFGIEGAMDVPFLKALVIPQFANYPGHFGVSALEQQNAIMKFSFAIGTIQMALGSLISVKKKISEKNLSWIADIGWLIAVVAMYMLTMFLVIGEEVPVKAVFITIGAAFLLVLVFGGMSPDKTFGQGLKAGIGDIFTVFLNTISCFGNVMSYIRLFAVGMAGFAISQSFNGIASGFKGPMVIAAVIILIIGHLLNLVMCFLSVVVHGVRLNVLEFSGQAGLEWTGIGYEPFKENEKIEK